MNCPKCGKKMEQESLKPEVVDWPAGVNCYDSQNKIFVEPKQITVNYIEGYWCRESTCNMGDKYIHNNGNHVYFLGTDVLNRIEKILR